MSTNTTDAAANGHPVVTRGEWLEKRLALLKAEKEFTRRKDGLSRQIRELPWGRIEKHYLFQTPDGDRSLAGLFGGKSQLVIQHFMLGPGWEEGCPSCSFTEEEIAGGELDYNYSKQEFDSTEAPGIGVFHKDVSGTVFHTYSAYGRGVEQAMGTYSVLDLVPNGRDEDGLDFMMAWVRHHDRYDDSAAEAGACCSERGEA